MQRLPLTIIFAALLGCDLPPTVAPFAKSLLGKLRDAIVDIDPATVVKGKLCDAYVAKGVHLAEVSWTTEWPKFAPIWKTAPDPLADIAFCTAIIENAGAKVVVKQSGSTAATAVCNQAQFPAGHYDRPIEIQAAVVCHEAAHIAEQESLGCVDWMDIYLRTISGRLTFEGTAYAFYAAMLERHGWSPERALAHIMAKAERFPETYSIPREIISDECTENYWSAIRAEFRVRSGV